MRVLAIDAAGGVCTAGLVIDGTVRAQATERSDGCGRSPIAGLAPLVARILEQAGTGADGLDLIGVVVGPGGFTGIRAALALAHGMSLATQTPVIGVTVGEAIGAVVQAEDRRLLVATDSRRGRFFLERDGTVETCAMPPPETQPVAVAGNAAILIMSMCAARGDDVMLLDARAPSALGIAISAVARHEGRLPLREAQPLYVDPPEARLPATKPRPAPASLAG